MRRLALGAPITNFFSCKLASPIADRGNMVTPMTGLVNPARALAIPAVEAPAVSAQAVLRLISF